MKKEAIGRVVLDKARTASYIPYTRGAQDVIETVFSTQVTFAGWPKHVHAFKGKVDYRLCASMTRAALATPEERARMEALDAQLLQMETRLIANLTG